MAIDGNLRGTLSATAGLSGTTSIADFITEAELEAALEDYATKENLEDFAENGTVAYAEELVSDEKVNSQTPYYFRPTAEGNIKVDSKAEINAIVGASAVVNQLVDASTTSVATINNHKYYCEINGAKSIQNGNGSPITVDGSRGDIVVDLTAFFGSSSVADYLYTLEQGSTGAGIAKLKSWGFDFSNFEYTPNSLESVSGLSAKKNVGLNQWDEVWEQGYIAVATGIDVPTTNNIRSKNYIPVIEGMTYRIQMGDTVAAGYYSPCIFYDENKNFLTSYVQQMWNRQITIPSGAKYMRFYLVDRYGATYKNDVNIFIHWDNSNDGVYEPYVEHTYPLDDSVTLRGRYEVDSNGNLKAVGDRWLPSGKIERVRGRANLGELTWSKISSGVETPYFMSNALSPIYKWVNANTNVICEKYLYATIGGSGSANGFFITDTSRVRIRDDATLNMTATEFKAYVADVYLEYELATPIEETASPYTSPQIVDNWGTEEFVTTSPISVGHDTDYPISLKDKIESFPDLPTADGTYLLKITNGVASWVAHS